MPWVAVNLFIRIHIIIQMFNDICTKYNNDDNIMEGCEPLARNIDHWDLRLCRGVLNIVRIMDIGSNIWILDIGMS